MSWSVSASQVGTPLDSYLSIRTIDCKFSCWVSDTARCSKSLWSFLDDRLVTIVVSSRGKSGIAISTPYLQHQLWVTRSWHPLVWLKIPIVPWLWGMSPLWSYNPKGSKKVTCRMHVQPDHNLCHVRATLWFQPSLWSSYPELLTAFSRSQLTLWWLSQVTRSPPSTWICIQVTLENNADQ